MPRSATSVLSAAFQATERQIVELYQVTLVTSDVYTFANLDADVASHASLGGVTWTAFPLDRDPARFGSDLRVDEMSARFSNREVTFGGSLTSFSALATRGTMDGAEVRIYLTDLTDPAGGRFFHSTWKIQGAEADRAEVTLKLESVLADLTAMTPRRTYQEQCNWSLFSPSCTLSRGAYSAFCQVASGATTERMQFRVNSGGPSVPATIPGSWFELGQLVFTSGPLNGLRRTVRVQSGQIAVGSVGNFDTLIPFPVTPNSGDSFTAVPGCNKTLDHNVGKFNNPANYGGFPFVPRPEVPFGF